MSNNEGRRSPWGAVVPYPDMTSIREGWFSQIPRYELDYEYEYVLQGLDCHMFRI